MKLVKLTAIAFSSAMVAALIVLSASAQQPSPAAPSNPNWCPGVPASPAPPHFENFPGEWAQMSKACSADRSMLSPGEARERLIGCLHICGYARGLWGSSKNSPQGVPSWPLSTNKPQGPFPLQGGGLGYVLPLPSFALSPTASATPTAPGFS
jgi:hypothetical protein